MVTLKSFHNVVIRITKRKKEKTTLTAKGCCYYLYGKFFIACFVPKVPSSGNTSKNTKKSYW